jgi:hypothetical protein
VLEILLLVEVISDFSVWYSAIASVSSRLSSSREASREVRRHSILPMAVLRGSSDHPEVTWTRERIGLDEPILASSARTRFASFWFGGIVQSLSMISSMAPITSTPCV